MKKVLTPIVLILVALFFVVVTSAQAQKKMKKEKVLMAAEDIKWEPLKGAPPGSGIMGALLWGNLEKGPFGILNKFPAGFKTPLHYHSSDLKAVIIKGAYIYVSESGEEKILGPGSYFFEPAKDKHETRGAEDSETIFYVEGTGKFDVVPVETKMEEKK